MRDFLRRAAILTCFSGCAFGQPAITFNSQIAPIIYQNCSPCHRPGESGPFSLITYDDVKRRAALIAGVTKRRYMPPWLPEKGYGDFADERRLTDAQIQLIRDWVDAGAPAGTGAAPAPPKFTSEWQLGKPDMVLHIQQPYQLAADGGEIFWNFIVPVPIAEPRFVRAIEVRPGNARVFHHANVIIDRSHAARRLEKSLGAGFSGMDIALEEDTFDPDGQFLSWKPGSPAVAEPNGMAWRAEPGMDLILNVHLRPTGKVETVNPEIAVYFSDQPRTRFPMLVQLENDQAIDIPAGEPDFVVTDEFKTPMDLSVLAVYPHAHYLGKLMEGFATLPDGTKKWLIRIPEWDLNWQGVYRFREPVKLPAGTVVSMRYHYDNSKENVRNPKSPPQAVKAGNQATDEMGHFWIQVLPAAEGDQRAALTEAVMRQRVVKHPGDFSANFTLGDLHLNQGDADGAIPFFYLATAAAPDNAIAATELGVALFAAKKIPEAREQFTRALKIDAHYTDARFNLASLEAASGEWAAAAGDFHQVLDERADYPKARAHLGEVLTVLAEEAVDAGRIDQAAARFREALQFIPEDAECRTNLGVALAKLGRMDEARAELETVVKANPSYEPARKALSAIRPR